MTEVLEWLLTKLTPAFVSRTLASGLAHTATGWLAGWLVRLLMRTIYRRFSGSVQCFMPHWVTVLYTFWLWFFLVGFLSSLWHCWLDGQFVPGSATNWLLPP